MFFFLFFSFVVFFVCSPYIEKKVYNVCSFILWKKLLSHCLTEFFFSYKNCSFHGKIGILNNYHSLFHMLKLEMNFEIGLINKGFQLQILTHLTLGLFSYYSYFTATTVFSDVFFFFFLSNTLKLDVSVLGLNGSNLGDELSLDPFLLSSFGF